MATFRLPAIYRSRAAGRRVLDAGGREWKHTSNDYASAIFKALISQGFLRFLGRVFLSLEELIVSARLGAFPQPLHRRLLIAQNLGLAYRPRV